MVFMNVAKVSITGMQPDNSGLSGGHSLDVASASINLSTNLESSPKDLSLVFSNGKSPLSSTEATSVAIQSNVGLTNNSSFHARG